MPGLVIRHFKKFIGQTFSLVVKFPVRMLFASMLKYLGLVPSSAFNSRFMLLHTQNTAGNGSSSWVPSTHARDVDWVLASRFSTAQPQLLWAFGEWSSGREQSVVTVFFLLFSQLTSSPSLPFSLSILSCPASSFLPFKKRVVKDLTCINVKCRKQNQVSFQISRILHKNLRSIQALGGLMITLWARQIPLSSG